MTYTAKQAAALLGLSSCQVRKIARERGLGQLLQAGPVRAWLFTQDDITVMRVRPRPGPVKGRVK